MRSQAALIRRVQALERSAHEFRVLAHEYKLEALLGLLQLDPLELDEGDLEQFATMFFKIFWEVDLPESKRPYVLKAYLIAAQAIGKQFLEQVLSFNELTQTLGQITWEFTVTNSQGGALAHLYPNFTSLEQGVVFRIAEVLSGVPNRRIKRCPASKSQSPQEKCGRMFLGIRARRKTYCSNRCAAREYQRRHREKEIS